jgi:ubiquinone/menaquinone biosynthesis C-methylase UbiE
MKSRKIVGVDVSPQMLRVARQRAGSLHPTIEVVLTEGDAEELPLDDGSVDYVFSHALTKHLPRPLQYRVLGEFARVAREGVICSFGVFNHFSYEVWRRRNLRESYPVLPEELHWMAEEAGLHVVTRRRCTTPVGVENSVLLQKR